MTAIYGENIPIEKHPEIRSEEACLLSSEKIIKLARQYHSKVHILHISTAKNWRYFQNIRYQRRNMCSLFVFR